MAEEAEEAAAEEAATEDEELPADEEPAEPPTWFRAADLAPYGALNYAALGTGMVAGAMVFERGREGMSPVWWAVALATGFVASLVSYIVRRGYWLRRAIEVDGGDRVVWEDIRRVVIRACARRLVVGAVFGLILAPVAVVVAWACLGLAAGTAVEGALVRRWERRHDRGVYRSVAHRGVALGPVAPH
jgi:hypothetical protein